MKKLILMLVLAFSIQGFSQTFTRTTKNGTATDRYNSCYQYIDCEGNVTLDYKDPGFEKAPIAFAPVENIVYSSAFQEKGVGHALAQISLGNTNGFTYLLHEDGRVFELTWAVLGANADETVIKMKPVGS